MSTSDQLGTSTVKEAPSSIRSEAWRGARFGAKIGTIIMVVLFVLAVVLAVAFATRDFVRTGRSPFANPRFAKDCLKAIGESIVSVAFGSILGAPIGASLYTVAALRGRPKG
jgi:hypothetical protein